MPSTKGTLHKEKVVTISLPAHIYCKMYNYHSYKIVKIHKHTFPFYYCKLKTFHTLE